jgi:hypothetical protein
MLLGRQQFEYLNFPASRTLHCGISAQKTDKLQIENVFLVSLYKHEKAICSGPTISFLVSLPLNYVNWNENIHFVPDFSLGSAAV